VLLQMLLQVAGSLPGGGCCAVLQAGWRVSVRPCNMAQNSPQLRQSFNA
jgi:hypothetical protein